MIQNCNSPSVRSSHSHPKAVELLFLYLKRHSMASPLMGEDRKESGHVGLVLSAPNRILRESLLLSLGIANYRGKENSSAPSTILFDDLEADKKINPHCSVYTPLSLL